METRKDKILFSIGTALLIIGLFGLTLLPEIIYSSFPTISYPLEFFKKIVGIFYFLAFLCYIFSPKYFTKQAFVVLLLYVCYFGILY